MGTVPGQSLTAPIFDSFFEAGNLDLAVKVKDNEYDLYMRTDSNARGHHQWFFFSVQNRTVSTIHFNILNFTKGNSLYEQGMRVALFSEKKAEKAAKGELPGLYKGWHRGCDNIVYKVSRLTQELYQKARISYTLSSAILIAVFTTVSASTTPSNIRGTRCGSHTMSRTHTAS